jgi:hypothetical protein
MGRRAFNERQGFTSTAGILWTESDGFDEDTEERADARIIFDYKDGLCDDSGFGHVAVA